MEKEFEIGDTVRLLSGGPLMTVNESNKARDFVDCIWFNVEGNKCESTFKMSIIMHDDDFGLDEFEMEEDEWNDDSEEEK